MSETELVGVFNFNIAEGYYFVLDILENGQGDVIGKTMRVCRVINLSET